MARSNSPFMQHRHFKLIADIIREMSARGFKATTEDVAMFFADSLSQTNPAFDHARFIAACMGNHTTSKDKIR